MKTLKSILMVVFVMVVSVGVVWAAALVNGNNLFSIIGSPYGDTADYYTANFTGDGSGADFYMIIESEFPDGSIKRNAGGYNTTVDSFYVEAFGDHEEGVTVSSVKMYKDVNGTGLWHNTVTGEIYSGSDDVEVDPNSVIINGVRGDFSIFRYVPGQDTVFFNSMVIDINTPDCTTDSDCAQDEVCDNGVCVECLYDSDCTDGVFCNGAEECFVGSCVAGTEPCNNDQTCDEASDTCVDIVDPDCYNDSDCTDGVFCNGVEQCSGGVCVVGTEPCDQDQICDEGSDTCVAEPECSNNADCDDGLYCNGIETCSSGVCASGSAPCSVELCNEGSDTCDDCVTNDDCDDGLYCNGDETCSDGECAFGSGPCYENETCEEASDQCLPEACDLEWDLDDDCDVDKDDAKLLKLQQKAEKTVLKIKHKAEKNAIKAALQ